MDSSCLQFTFYYLWFLIHTNNFNKPNPNKIMEFNKYFSQQKLNTTITWADVVFNESTTQQINEIVTWSSQGGAMLNNWGLQPFVKPGYKVLFHGPSGTGKTLAVRLIANLIGKNVYQINFLPQTNGSLEETAQQLFSLFAQAETEHAILLFDEADAIFGKRQDMENSSVDFSNLNRSYLMQLIENFNGIIVIETNRKESMDMEYFKDLHLMTHFSMPNVIERESLWTKAFPAQLNLNALDLKTIAERFELSGGQIMNVVYYACLQTFPSIEMKEQDVLQGIKKELSKA